MSEPKETSQPNQFVLPTFDLPGGGQIRETFKVDRYGNTYQEHTTIQLPGGQSRHEPWPDQNVPRNYTTESAELGMTNHPRLRMQWE